MVAVIKKSSYSIPIKKSSKDRAVLYRVDTHIYKALYRMWYWVFLGGPVSKLESRFRTQLCNSLG